MYSFLTTAFNRYLKLDPQSTTRIKKLSGKKVNVELQPLKLKLALHFHEEEVEIEKGLNETAETTIRGTPLQLMGLMIEKENRQSFFADDVEIEGNAALGQAVVGIFDEMQIDWEEYLSKWIGDVPAYHTGRYVSALKDFFNNCRDNLADNVNDYVHEEKSWLPTHEALQDFFDDIDSVRMHADRLEARVHLLNNELKNKA